MNQTISPALYLFVLNVIACVLVKLFYLKSSETKSLLRFARSFIHFYSSKEIITAKIDSRYFMRSNNFINFISLAAFTCILVYSLHV